MNVNQFGGVVMNILLVADYAAPYEGNFINSIKRLEEKVKKNDGKMIYSFPEKAKNIDWIVELGKTRKVYFHSRSVFDNLKYFEKIIKENEIDRIYSHFCIPRTQFALKIISKLKKIILVQHYHNHYQMPSNSIKKMLLEYIFKGDLNIGCSESVAKSIPYKNVIAIPNAINFQRLEKYEHIKLAEDNRIVILMFGFDYERKGVDIAIKALEEIAEKYNIILAISIAVKLEQLKQKIMDEFREIPKFVKFLEPRDDIASYYYASDIFLSAAREEGLCYSNIEAVYCKVKCIFSNLEEQPLDIPYVVGFESENVNDLKDKIVKLIEKDELNNEIEKNESQKYVKEKYDIDKWTDEVYKSLNNETKINVN